MDNRGEVVAQSPLGLNGWKCCGRMVWGVDGWGEEWGCGEGDGELGSVGENIGCVE